MVEDPNTRRSKALAKFAPLAAVSLLAGALAACSGKSNDAPVASVSPLAGAWISTNATGNKAYALILPTNGTFRAFLADTTLATGTVTLSPTTLGGTASVFPTGAPTALGAGPSQVTLSGTGSSTVFNPTFTSVGGTTASFAFAPDTAANVSTSLTALAGTYKAAATQDSDGVGGTITLTAAGVLSGSDSNGTLSGTLTQVAANLNAFTVTFTYTPAAGTSGSPLAFTGLAYLRPGAAPSVVLMSNASTAQYSGVYALVP